MKPRILLSLFLLLCASAALRDASAAENQLLFQSKFIETTEDVVKKSEILSERKYENLQRNLAQKQGVDILSAPSVLARDGQDAKIEVVREFPVPVGHKGDTDREFETLNTGVTLTLDGMIKGGDIHLIGKAVVRELDPVPEKSKLPSLKSKSAKAKGPFITSFNTTETVFDTVLEDGETIVIACRQSDRIQGQLLIAVTASLIDPAAQPVKTAATGK